MPTRADNSARVVPAARLPAEPASSARTFTGEAVGATVIGAVVWKRTTVELDPKVACVPAGRTVPATVATTVIVPVA